MSAAPPYGDGVFGAGVDDGLQQVVQFSDVQLSLHHQFLDLLLHSQSYGCRDLFLQGGSTTRQSTI